MSPCYFWEIMPRAFHRRSSLVAVTCGALTLILAAACGMSDVASSTDPTDDAAGGDGPITLPDGRVIDPDGAPLADTGPKPGDSGKDSDALADGASDAGLDAMLDADAPPVDPPGPLSADYVDYDINH